MCSSAVLDALALVGFGRAQLADVRGSLADDLLVGARTMTWLAFGSSKEMPSGGFTVMVWE
jgi:hypothetical protein